MDLTSTLSQFGVVSLKGTRIRVSVSTSVREDRRTILQQIAAATNGQILYDCPSFSSIGYVSVDGYKISVKSEKLIGDRSAGLSNEQTLKSAIDKYISGDSLRIVFESDQKSYVLDGVTDTDLPDRKKRSGAFKKADLKILSYGKWYSFSVKQDDGEKWESADSACGDSGKKVLLWSMMTDKTKLSRVERLTNHGFPVCRIDPELYFEMTDSEKQQVVFGEDILDNGAVIRKSFSDADFNFCNSTLHVKCSRLYTCMEDLTEEDVPYWLVRHDPTRNSKKIGIPGIRIEAAARSRIRYANRINF